MDVTAEDIDGWHRKRGWKNGIGYHYVIRRDGMIEKGRSLDMVGAHTKGHNKDSIGICIAGGKGSKRNDNPMDHYTREQWKSLTRLIEGLQVTVGPLTLHGHNEVSSKACPGFQVGEYFT